MKKPGKLSIIIPFCNEHPQVAFTVQNIDSELRVAGFNYEIIVVNNWCDEAAAQGREPDGGGSYLKSLFEPHPARIYLEYTKKLSHWNAKNMGVQASSGEFLWFVDGHCLIDPHSLANMYWHYAMHHEEIHGTMHMPIVYMLDHPKKKLIYSLLSKPEHGIVHYKFQALDPMIFEPFRVPCMSTCGVMMTRAMYDEIGGWPEELGIYGGGENYLNFTLAICRYNATIYPKARLFHYAAKRGYNWNWLDFHRNRIIASYMYGDVEWAERYTANVKGTGPTLNAVCHEVTHNASCMAHRERIRKIQKISIDEWLKEQANPA